MKVIRHGFFALLLLLVTVLPAIAGSDDSTGLPGDNFSLHGALELFKSSATPEEFEKLLNTESSNVNNLDLNEDGETDYIKVLNRRDGDVQIFVLQVAVSASEDQDIAVIGIEKNGAASALLQIIGDEDIYGVETVVEPADQRGAGEDKNGGVNGPSIFEAEALDGVVVNVWAWPLVRTIYAPGYRVWVSPFAWTVRPMWWKPWRPVRWHVFAPRRAIYHRHFVVVPRHRVFVAHRMYRPSRVVAVSVRSRHQVSVGRYRTTRTTTTVHGRHGKKVKVTKTRVHRRR